MGKRKKGKIFNVFFVFLILIIVGIVGISFYLFSQFQTGDLVYNKEIGMIGEVQGISFPNKYLIEWQDGSLTRVSLFNLQSLSELDDLEVTTILEEEKTSEIYYYPGELREESVEELMNIGDMSGEEIIPKLDGKGNFILMLGEQGCKPNFVCSDWGECQAIYGLDSLGIDKSASGFQYRYCKDYSKCLSDFSDSKKCQTRAPITTKIIQLGDKEYTEIYDEEEVLISRLSRIKEKKLDIQILFDEFSYFPYCFDGIKNYDEDDVDCVNEKNGNCPACEQNFYSEKGKYFLMIVILIILIVLCLIFIIWYLILVRKR